MTREQHRHVIGLVTVTVKKIGAEKQQGIIEQGLAAFIDLLHAAKQIGKLLHVKLVRF